MNFNDRFCVSDTFAGRQLYECMTCGAVVENTERHEEWHQEFDYLSAKAQPKGDK